MLQAKNLEMLLNMTTNDAMFLSAPFEADPVKDALAALYRHSFAQYVFLAAL